MIRATPSRAAGGTTVTLMIVAAIVAAVLAVGLIAAFLVVRYLVLD